MDVTPSMVSISAPRHSHMTRRTPRCYYYAPCPIEMGAAPRVTEQTLCNHNAFMHSRSTAFALSRLGHIPSSDCAPLESHDSVE